jgi:hypothetical protein
MNNIINSDDVKKQLGEISNFFNKDSINEIARATNFVQRESKLDGSMFLSIFILGMNMYGTPTLQQLIGLLNIIIPGFEISREGFHQRINEYAVTFFEFMLSQAINISSTEVDLELLSYFHKVLILDSTIIELPETLAEAFKGAGGAGSKSSLKIQFCFDLKLGSFFYFIQEGVTSDGKYENSFVDKINEHELIIKDLGYFTIDSFIDMESKGAYYLSRWKSNTKIYVKNEVNEIIELNIEKFFENIDSITEIEIYIKKKDKFSKARLVVERVPEEITNIRLRKLNKKSKSRGTQTQSITKLFQRFNVYFSNIPKEGLLMSNFRKLYGSRWQIELVFKNWKSNFKLDKISGFKEERIKCMLYSKLILIVISTKLISQLRNIYWKEFKIEISDFKSSKHLIIIFQDILKIVITKTSSTVSNNKQKKIFNLLLDSLTFISKNCIKIKQKTRTYLLDMIDSMHLT